MNALVLLFSHVLSVCFALGDIVEDGTKDRLFSQHGSDCWPLFAGEAPPSSSRVVCWLLVVAAWPLLYTCDPFSL